MVRPNSGINGVVRPYAGKGRGTRGAHPSLNDWLYLKQRGLDSTATTSSWSQQHKLKKGTMDAADETDKANAPPLWHGCVTARSTPPASPSGRLFAKAAGLKVIDVEPQPMI